MDNTALLVLACLTAVFDCHVAAFDKRFARAPKHGNNFAFFPLSLPFKTCTISPFL